MSYTLVVVDMQEAFESSFSPSVIVGVTQEILKAKAERRPILVLEYKNCGDTHWGLLGLLAGYGRKARITKDDDDGSREIMRAIRRRGFVDKRIRLCGVNTDCCVLATAQGLIQRNPGIEVEVAKRACNTYTVYRYDWRTYPRLKNLRLV